jgi:ATP-binding cassette subfamily B protein
MQAYKWIWQYIRKHRKFMIFGLTLCLAASALSLVNPIVSGRIVDEVFEQGMAYRLRPLLIIMIAVTAFKSAINYAFKQVFEITSQKILVSLRKDIYRRVQLQTFNFFDTNRVGDIMSRMTGDLEAVRHFLAYVVYGLFENVVIFIAAVILMFSMSWEIALLILAVTPAIGIVAMRQSKAIKPAFSRVREQFSKLNSVCQENISGNRVVKAFSKEEYETQKFNAENQEYLDANVASSRIWVKYLPILEFCAGLLFFILLVAGGILVITGRLELWKMVTVNGYLWAISNPLRMVGWLLNDTQRFNASLDKVYSMMRMPINIKSSENAFDGGEITGKVEFKNVSFGYDTERPKNLALKDISFTALPGQTIGIVGATGSGKTTLINLISRFYDTVRGEILVDDINVKDYNLFNLRRYIAAATQDVFLFSDTIEGNIAYGVPDVPLEGVLDAAKSAGAHEFVSKMEEGYDTIVGERGVGLSGGQKQRLALARALAANPSILILDDTTSAVDMETEHEIQVALNEKYNGKTKFIIAHRLSSVMHADLILVMENGEITERGTHSELLEQKGSYFSLFINQYGDYAKMIGQGGMQYGA